MRNILQLDKDYLKSIKKIADNGADLNAIQISAMWLSLKHSVNINEILSYIENDLCVEVSEDQFETLRKIMNKYYEFKGSLLIKENTDSFLNQLIDGEKIVRCNQNT